ncbi:hypothetical protein BAUCODRAFT_180887 [Baudoinia panamericana UAMH 10762]|uniref:Uncharacterized protein n=1 Tax=Baudoinia panamericana (strain UAMH 10762) TaxID=717646 RepID=M2NNB1_BAUPA|nr:uncharacterized protein BAUCODRAFT_180887 [Baudoinia panamericana UAMH 10762]EMD00721.1 hypothetical protein BAUCODRAFT_180887 [Baudoinia panamericana UAMH 10762]
MKFRALQHISAMDGSFIISLKFGMPPPPPPAPPPPNLLAMSRNLGLFIRLFIISGLLIKFCAICRIIGFCMILLRSGIPPPPAPPPPSSEARPPRSGIPPPPTAGCERVGSVPSRSGSSSATSPADSCSTLRLAVS